MYSIQGCIQHYAWGGKTYLPALLQQDNVEENPFAEYWLGVHPAGVGKVDLGQDASTLLNQLIGSDRKRYLGESTASTFNGLPFLLKVLDVKDMLSIQVHPTKEAALQGFIKEEQAGILVSAPHRNYKDQNHKPEVMIALSDFWLLHGFSPAIEERLRSYSFLYQFLPIYQKGGIKLLYEHVLTLPQEKVNEMLSSHAKQILPLYTAGRLTKESPDFWAARAMLNFCPDGQFDKGIYSIYLMNILHLSKGEGIFQGAGLLHAYLEGQNIELMSNSDNVLRAGLTPKHIDIPELLSNTQFVVTHPEIIPASLNQLHDYPCATDDFCIKKLSLAAGEQFKVELAGPAILLQLTGEALWHGFNQLKAVGMASFFVEPFEPISVNALTTTEVYIATVPV